MALTLNAEQKSVYHIFSGENQYVIPPYQRAYLYTIQIERGPYYYHERITIDKLVELDLIKNNDEEYLAELINIAYKFIQESNEN